MRGGSTSGTSVEATMREYWLCDQRGLDEIAALIAAEFDAALSSDSENSYEWFQGWSGREGLTFNISRAHAASRSSPTNPVRISLLGPGYTEATVHVVGGRLAQCLRAPVSFGDITYTGEDEFEFHEHHLFRTS